MGQDFEIEPVEDLEDSILEEQDDIEQESITDDQSYEVPVMPEDERILVENEYDVPLDTDDQEFGEITVDDIKESLAVPKYIWVMLSVAGILFVLGLLGFIIGRGSMKSTSQEKQYIADVSTVWDTRVQESRGLANLATSLSGRADLNRLDRELGQIKPGLSSDITALASTDIPEKYQSAHRVLVEYLVDYQDYLNRIQQLINRADFIDLDESLFLDLANTGEGLFEKSRSFRLDTDFIKQEVNRGAFNILPDNLRRLSVSLGRQAQEDDLQQEEEEKLKEEEELQKEEEERLLEEERKQKEELDQAIREVVTNFLDAFVDGNISLAQRFLDPALVDSYDLFQGEDDRVISYTISSQIEQDAYVLFVVRVTREMIDPAYTPPLSPEVSEPIEVPLIQRTSTQEIRVAPIDDAWKIIYFDLFE